MGCFSEPSEVGARTTRPAADVPRARARGPEEEVAVVADVEGREHQPAAGDAGLLEPGLPAGSCRLRVPPCAVVIPCVYLYTYV